MVSRVSFALFFLGLIIASMADGDANPAVNAVDQAAGAEGGAGEAPPASDAAEASGAFDEIKKKAEEASGAIVGAFKDAAEKIAELAGKIPGFGGSPSEDAVQPVQPPAGGAPQ
uniref:DUF148 domain-containing protein n=1 Tax=Steinernema glaseri TaxID=37863 RepID=A0A1I7Z304_9BILA